VAQQEFDPYALLETLRAGGDVDLIRTSVELVLQALIEAEATGVIGAAPHERSDERTNYRNGHRPRLSRPRPATSSSRSRSCVRARSSPRSSSAGAASTVLCTRS
jgi:hypothetical protein